MAEKALGDNREMILYGLDEERLEVVNFHIVDNRIDLSGLIGPDNKVLRVREAGKTTDNPEEKSWIRIVNALFQEQARVRKAIEWKGVGKYALAKIGPTIPNSYPFMPEEGEEPTGEEKYLFLNAKDLAEHVSQENRDRFPEGLGGLAINLKFVATGSLDIGQEADRIIAIEPEAA